MTNDGGLEGLLVTKLEVMPPASARGQVGALDGNVLFFSKLMEIWLRNIQAGGAAGRERI